MMADSTELPSRRAAPKGASSNIGSPSGRAGRLAEAARKQRKEEAAATRRQEAKERKAAEAAAKAAKAAAEAAETAARAAAAPNSYSDGEVGRHAAALLEALRRGAGAPPARARAPSRVARRALVAAAAARAAAAAAAAEAAADAAQAAVAVAHQRRATQLREVRAALTDLRARGAGKELLARKLSQARRATVVRRQGVAKKQAHVARERERLAAYDFQLPQNSRLFAETAAQRDLRGKLETIEQAVALLSLTIADDPFMKANLQGVFTNYEDQRAELEATLLESGADPARPPS